MVQLRKRKLQAIDLDADDEDRCCRRLPVHRRISCTAPTFKRRTTVIDRADKEGEPSSASESDVDSDNEVDEEPEQAPPPSANKSPKVAEVPFVLARFAQVSAADAQLLGDCDALQAKAKAAPGSGRKRGRQHAEVQPDDSATLLGAAHSNLHARKHAPPGTPDCKRSCWSLCKSI